MPSKPFGLTNLLEGVQRNLLGNSGSLGTELTNVFQSVDQGLTGARGFVGDILGNVGFRASLELPNLKGDVTVSREPSGVVHIKAENDDDLFYTLGFVHASDRLWQMDFQRRVAAGRLSEVLGETTLQQDKLNRTLGLYSAAESAYANLAPAVKQVVDDYASGINAYLNLNLPLPAEFLALGYRPDPWRPADVLAGIKLQSLGLSTNFQAELYRSQLITQQGLSFERIQELFPPYQGDVTILQPDDVARIPGLATTSGLTANSLPNVDLSDLAPPINVDLSSVDSLLELSRSLAPTMASNNWVVSGSRTTTGKPFLANDPHLNLQIPSLWYLAHLESPSYNTIGATFPGLPGVAIGRNDRIAWGVTNSQADVQDLYVMIESPTQPGQYIYNNQFQAYETRTETIKVRGGSDVVIPVRETVYGPVISDALGIPQPVSLQWVSLAETDNTLGAFLGINRAQNWTEFTEALKSYVAPGQNFVYADVDGNIGYILPGQFPIRRPQHTGLTPIAGTGLYDWQGFIPFDQLPQVLNPASGYIVTANNRIAPDNYPYTLGYEWAEPYRAERIRDLILSKDKLSLDDMQAIQLDQTTLLYRDFKPILQQLQPILNTLNPVPTETLNWLNQLLNWDGNLQPGSKTATVFEAWYNELTKFLAAAIGQEVLEGNAQEPAPRFLLKALTVGDPAVGTVAEAQVKAALALQRVVDSYAGAVPRWGDIHQAVIKHPVLPIARQVEFGGDRYTINVGTYNSKTFLMDRNGPSYRQLIDLSNPENSRYIYPIGQSGKLLSPYFENLLPLWQQGRYLPMQTDGFRVALEVTLESGTDSNLRFEGIILSGLV